MRLRIGMGMARMSTLCHDGSRLSSYIIYGNALADKKWEGSLFWTARSADWREGYDAAGMGVTAWWLLYWEENLRPGQPIRERVHSYARFLAQHQLGSGAIPTFFYGGHCAERGGAGESRAG